MNLSERVFQDPLSESTMRARKWLLFLSVFSILISVYDLKIHKIPWLEIEIPQDGPNILPGSISLSLLYFFTIFVLYGLIDLWRWRQAGSYAHLISYWDLTLSGRQSAHNVAHFLESGKFNAHGEIVVKSIQEHMDKALLFFNEVDSKVAEVKTRHRKLGAAQWLRLVLLDISIPVILALVSLYLMVPSVWPFLQVIYSSLVNR